MSEKTENNLDQYFDFIFHQLTKGNTVEGLKNKRIIVELERVKEWKSKYNFQFHIYPNDHFIENKPHFHFVKRSEDLECRVFFDGNIIDYKGKGRLDKRAYDALKYFLESERHQTQLKELWNKNNPNLLIK
jgi:hypothetical protein